ncbi:MAG: hypothetical protein PHO34_00105 [Candidatus Omnitrophica bacterium]|jgi:hypothetical protein|nr:hypothetical protein [Candidatus Omnitrophota bacterium]MDD5042315.1 hypothetical protein [Candidatus Omnitrophota bacterium]MDD5500460.1 hypothetical protein [Candidatus Omnitrophota bacterium]
MADFIASEKDNINWRLDKLEDISVTQALTVKLFKNREVNDNHRVLIVNQYADTKAVLELASMNLILSAESVVKKISRTVFSSDDSNAKELLVSNYLMNSIVYYNASFDYLKLLIRVAYSSYSDLIGNFPKQKIDEVLNKFQLKEEEWETALREIISKIKFEEFKKWLNGSLSSDLIKKYVGLQNLNKDLRFKYQANRLKHQAVPHFRRSDLGNAIGVRCSISREQFYNKDNIKSSFYFGFPQNTLDINDTQRFLIKYNNKTVELVRDLKIADIFL